LSAASFARALRNEYLCGWLFDPAKIKEKLRKPGPGSGVTPSKKETESPAKPSNSTPTPPKVEKKFKEDAKNG